MHRRKFKGKKLSRKSGPRKALVRNLISQIILHEKIVTTVEKAKEVKPTLEKLITRAKSGTLADRRVAARTLSNNDLALVKLFEELGPLYKERNGGYARIIKLGARKGDGAQLAQISLLDTELLTKKELVKKEVRKRDRKEALRQVQGNTGVPGGAAAPKAEKKAVKTPAFKKSVAKKEGKKGSPSKAQGGAAAPKTTVPKKEKK